MHWKSFTIEMRENPLYLKCIKVLQIKKNGLRNSYGHR